MNYPNYTGQQSHTAETMAFQLRWLSTWIDNHPPNAQRDLEAATWGRIAKVGEEIGEAAEDGLNEPALRALSYLNGNLIAKQILATNQNPRKPYTATGDVPGLKETLDIAVTALCAAEHLSGNQGKSMEMLHRHLTFLVSRASG